MSAIIDTLTATLQAAPDSWQCRLALVEALVSENRADEAHSVLSSVTELPSDLESQLMAGKAFGLLEPTSGIGIFDGIVSEDPSCARAYLEKSRLLLAAGDADSALKQYTLATTLDATIADPELANQLTGAPAPAPAVPVTPLSPPTQAPAEPAPVQQPTEAPIQQPVPIQQAAPIQPPTEAPIQQPAPIQQAAPIQPPTEAPIQQPAPVQQAAPVQQPTEAPIQQPTPVQQAAPVQQPTEAPIQQPAPVQQAAPIQPPTQALSEPVAIPQPTANVAPVQQPAPTEVYQPLDRSDVYYPSPGEYPTVTLREALGVAAPVALVDPNAVPELPALAYQEEVQYVETYYTPEEQYVEQLNNVEVHSAHYEEAVTYDYQQPDDTIFEPTVTEDDIYVSALVTDTGEPVANLQENITRSAKEKEEQNRKRAMIDKLVSVLIALASVVVACLVMMGIVSAIPRPKPPQIVATQPGPTADTDIEVNKIEKTQLTAAASAPAMSMDITTAATSSSITMAQFDMPPTDFGMVSMDSTFDSSMTFGSEGGGMVSFFGSKTTSSKVVFVVDASASMKQTGEGKKTKMELMKEELIKTVKVLPSSVEFQILFFSGPSWFLDITPLKNSDALDPQAVVRKHHAGMEKQLLKTSWKKHASGKNFWEYKGGDPKNWEPAKYIKATPSNRRMAIEMIKGTPMMLGTDWRDPLKMAMIMKPDTIYFMTDGAVGKHPDKKPVVEDVLSFNKTQSKATINTVCMMVLKASENLEELADKTKGEFTLVKEDGTSVRGSELKRLMKK